jgi:hypothetical protein
MKIKLLKLVAYVGLYKANPAAPSPDKMKKK